MKKSREAVDRISGTSSAGLIHELAGIASDTTKAAAGLQWLQIYGYAHEFFIGNETPRG
jgi:hypothetical protein